jgi:hypothetical protein
VTLIFPAKLYIVSFRTPEQSGRKDRKPQAPEQSGRKDRKSQMACEQKKERTLLTDPTFWIGQTKGYTVHLLHPVTLATKQTIPNSTFKDAVRNLNKHMALPPSNGKMLGYVVRGDFADGLSELHPEIRHGFVFPVSVALLIGDHSPSPRGKVKEMISKMRKLLATTLKDHDGDPDDDECRSSENDGDPEDEA